jgi:hypothetical protein
MLNKLHGLILLIVLLVGCGGASQAPSTNVPVPTKTVAADTEVPVPTTSSEVTATTAPTVEPSEEASVEPNVPVVVSAFPDEDKLLGEPTYYADLNMMTVNKFDQDVAHARARSDDQYSSVEPWNLTAAALYVQSASDVAYFVTGEKCHLLEKGVIYKIDLTNLTEWKVFLHTNENVPDICAA